MRINTYHLHPSGVVFARRLTIRKKHINVYPELRRLYNIDKNFIMESPNGTIHDDVIDAFNSPNGKAKTFGGLYIQNILGGNEFLLSINDVEYFETQTIAFEDHLIEINFEQHYVAFHRVSRYEENSDVKSVNNQSNSNNKENYMKLLKQYKVVSNFTYITNFATKFVKVGYYSLPTMTTHYHIDNLRIFNLMKMCGKDSDLFPIVNKSLLISLMSGKSIPDKKRSLLHKEILKYYEEVNDMKTNHGL